MPIDRKYGRVTLERQRHLEDDEPVVVFAAHDRFLPRLLRYYRDLCDEGGSPENHLTLLDQTKGDVMEWQAEHGSRVPTSAGVDP